MFVNKYSHIFGNFFEIRILLSSFTPKCLMQLKEKARDNACFPASYLLTRQIKRQEKSAGSQMKLALFMQNMQDEGLVTGD